MPVDGKTLGLALSGGGYRATLFGLGSLWRLNDAGLLGKIDRMTSVSGGSIVMAVLAHRWKDLAFQEGCAANFPKVIAEPVMALCSTTIDVGAALAGFVMPFKTAGEFLGDAYSKHLFGQARLKDLPAAGPDTPKFTFYATNMQTGRSFRFRQDMVADYLLGTNVTVDPLLSRVIAASSAFPPIFSPVILPSAPKDWKDGADIDDLDALRRSIVLADGGIYDNMGLESLLGNVDILLVSDAGAPFAIKKTLGSLFQLGRVRDVLIDQTRALRKRWLIDEFKAGRKRGAYWGIGTRIGAYGDVPRLTDDSPASAALENIPTRLCAFDAGRQGQLINWGYALCDIALRVRAGLPIRPAEVWPVPQWSLPKERSP